MICFNYFITARHFLLLKSTLLQFIFVFGCIIFWTVQQFHYMGYCSLSRYVILINQRQLSVYALKHIFQRYAVYLHNQFVILLCKPSLLLYRMMMSQQFYIETVKEKYGLTTVCAYTRRALNTHLQKARAICFESIFFSYLFSPSKFGFRWYRVLTCENIQSQIELIR